MYSRARTAGKHASVVAWLAVCDTVNLVYTGSAEHSMSIESLLSCIDGLHCQALASLWARARLTQLYACCVQSLLNDSPQIVQVAALQSAGAIVLGKGNMGEFAFDPDESVGSAFGICRNPYNLDYTTAGMDPPARIVHQATAEVQQHHDT